MAEIRSSEASALHAAIDDDYLRVDAALADYSSAELRSLASDLEDLADWCRTAATARTPAKEAHRA